MHPNPSIRSQSNSVFGVGERRAWAAVRITRVESNLPEEVQVGDAFEPSAWVQLAGLQPEDVAVDVYAGRLDEAGEILDGISLPMQPTGRGGGDGVEYRGVVPSKTSGLHGFTVRVLPRHDEQAHPHESGLIHWAS